MSEPPVTCSAPSAGKGLPAPVAGLGLFLVLITALVRLGTSLYLPALPAMGSALSLTPRQLAFTMTAYLAGFAAASLLAGPLSDHRGRRLLISGGIFLFCAGSLCCAVARNYELLLAGRMLQAVGGSAIPVATRAMAFEAFSEREMISVLGWIGTLSGLVPVLAPLLGGLLTQGMGWRANFYLLAGVALLVWVVAQWQAPETLPPGNRLPFDLRATVSSYGEMLRSPGFVLPLVPAMLCFALQGGYLVASPFVFIHLLHLSPVQFGSTSLLLVGGLMGGRSLCLALHRRRGPYVAFLAGAQLTFLGGLLFLVCLLTGNAGVAAILLATTLFCLGFGALLPVAMRAGLAAFPERAGTSSALFGALTLGASAAGSAILGGLLQRGERDLFLLGISTVVAGFLILASGILCRRRMIGVPS